jgi:hypothetical protein
MDCRFRPDGRGRIDENAPSERPLRITELAAPHRLLAPRRAGNGPTACEPLMSTKPSERIVVFVTPAQKLAISKTADDLGISVSELMRRAVLNFNATSEQIKAAGIVDRLRAPKAPDALNAALKSVAQKAAAREAREAAATATRHASKSSTRPSERAASTEHDSQTSPDDDADSAGEDTSLTGGQRS